MSTCFYRKLSQETVPGTRNKCQVFIVCFFFVFVFLKNASERSPSLAEEGRVLRRGARRSLQVLSNVPSLLMFLLTFSLRMERITLMMLTLLSGTLRRTQQRYHSNMSTGYVKLDFRS